MFSPINSVLSAFAAKGSQLSEYTKLFAQQPFLSGMTIVSGQKMQMGTLGKKILFCLKLDNMGIESCILLPLNISSREKVKM